MNTQRQSRSDAAWNAVGVLVLFLLSLFYSSFVACLIWNWTMPALFDLPTLTLWQMVAGRIVAGAIRGPGELPKEADPTPYRSALNRAIRWTILLGLSAIATAFI